jgi:hypothetical protein
LKNFIVELDGGKWPSSHRGLTTPSLGAPCTHSNKDWVLKYFYVSVPVTLWLRKIIISSSRTKILAVVWCGCETRSLTLRAERRLKVSQN